MSTNSHRQFNSQRQFIKILFTAFLFVFITHHAFCDSAVLQLYKQRFSRAGLSEKTQILRDAADDRTLDSSISLFYVFALQYAFDNAVILRDDYDLANIIYIAATGLQSTGQGGAVLGEHL